MSKAEVLRRLGEPLLTQVPFDGFTGGCVYYAMADTPLANVHQFCFDDNGINLVLTAFSQQQPDPPADASDPRIALIARADSVCQGQQAKLDPITSEVGEALDAFNTEPSDKNLAAVVEAIGKFIDNLKVTHEALAAFQPPPNDKRESLEEYLDGLKGQIDALTEAKVAISNRKFDDYEDAGEEFTDIGLDARAAAQRYGFTICSAGDWG